MIDIVVKKKPSDFKLMTYVPIADAIAYCIISLDVKIGKGILKGWYSLYYCLFLKKLHHNMEVSKMDILHVSVELRSFSLKNDLENCFIWNYKLFPFSYILKQWNILEIRITKTGKSGLGESYLSFHIAY